MTENEMTGLLIKLADLGVTGIKVHYDGGGDSGAIENIAYTTEPCEDIDDVEDKIDLWGSDAKDLKDLDENAYNLLYEFAHEKLLDDIEDWWNNDGGYGDICICVPSGKYMINNSIRVTNTEFYAHKGGLIDKTL